MKYQFTTEGSKSQTHYWTVVFYYGHRISPEALAWEQTISTPLSMHELFDFIGERLLCKHDLEFEVKQGFKERPVNGIMGLDSLARILSNIKPLKQKVIITICGEKKTYELDADKLETLLKSLE